MSHAIHQASIAVMDKMIAALSRILTKAEHWADGRKISHEVILQARLAPDMFPLVKQVQIATDFAKGTASRLAGVEVPSWPDTERSFAELQARLQKTRDYIAGFTAERLAGAETRPVSIKIGGEPMTFDGADYLNFLALPNFYFHLTTAYAILRHNGLDLGKGDYMGRT
ncbi:MAG: DUF1993 domain-containing protein [Beijerinckiaceae bacterium]